MFGENPQDDGPASPVSDAYGYLRTIRWMNITVLKECAEFPFLEMDESCMYFHTDL